MTKTSKTPTKLSRNKIKQNQQETQKHKPQQNTTQVDNTTTHIHTHHTLTHNSLTYTLIHIHTTHLKHQKLLKTPNNNIKTTAFLSKTGQRTVLERLYKVNNDTTNQTPICIRGRNARTRKKGRNKQRKQTTIKTNPLIKNL